MDNVIKATFREGAGNVVYTRKMSQYDRGVVLRISGVALPEQYQVHFSNDEQSGVSVSVFASGSDIRIPDAFFETGKFIYVWIFFVGESISRVGRSEYRIIIPVEPRPSILTIPTSEEGDIVASMGEDHTLIFTRIT